MGSEVKVSGNRVQIKRMFAAPRELVFSFWTDAEKYRKWSGCHEATECEVEMDFRVGGSFTQRLLNAGICLLTIKGEYEEIVVPQRIVYRATFGEAPAHVEVDFLEVAGGTQTILTIDGISEEMIRTEVTRGHSESFDMLEPFFRESPPVGAI